MRRRIQWGSAAILVSALAVLAVIWMNRTDWRSSAAVTPGGQIGPFLSFEAFGARADGSSDDSAAINAAIAYQCANPSWPILPRINVVYALAHPIVDHCGAEVDAGDNWQTQMFGSYAPNAASRPIGRFVVKWVGNSCGGALPCPRPVPFYMADIGAVGGEPGHSRGSPVLNASWLNVVWDCNGTTGCGGALVHSTKGGHFGMTGWEPRPALYTAAASPITITAASVAKTLGGALVGGQGYGADVSGTLTWVGELPDGSGTPQCPQPPAINVATGSSGAVRAVTGIAEAGNCNMLPAASIYLSHATITNGGSGYGVGVSGTLIWQGAGCSTPPVIRVVTARNGAIDRIDGFARIGVCRQEPRYDAPSWKPGSGLEAGTGATFSLSPWMAGGGLSNGSGVQIDVVSDKLNLTNADGIIPAIGPHGVSISHQAFFTANAPVGKCPISPSCARQAVLQLTSVAGLKVGEMLESWIAGSNAVVIAIDARVNQVTLSENLQFGVPDGGLGVAFTKLPPGIVAENASGDTLTLTGNLLVPLSGGETIGGGGECVRVDTTPWLQDVDDNINNHWRSMSCRNMANWPHNPGYAAPTVQGPGIQLGGTQWIDPNTGMRSGGGNWDGNQVDFVNCSYVFNGYPCVAFGYADHNKIELLMAGNPVILTGGSPDGLNGGTVGLQIRAACGSPAVPGPQEGYRSSTAATGLVIDENIVQCGPNTPDVDPFMHQVIWRNDGETFFRSADTEGGSVFPNGTIATGSTAIATASRECVLMGLGAVAAMTPWNTGRVTATFTGQLSNTAAGLVDVAIYWGTGPAPRGGIACRGQGTQVPGSGQNINFYQSVGTAYQGFVTTGQIAAPSSVGVPLWFDLGVTVDRSRGMAQPRQTQFTYQEN